MAKTEWEKWKETVAGMLRENEESFFNGENWAVFWATSETYGVEWHCDMLHGAMDRKGNPTAWLTETDRDLAEDILWEDEEGYLGIEDHGRKMVRRWAYLPNAKDVRGNDFWKDAEKEKPDAGEWVLAVKSYTGPYDGGAIYYYEMSKYEEGKGWLKTEEGSKHEKTIWWARLPDLGW